jgi:hypothetical protein
MTSNRCSPCCTPPVVVTTSPCCEPKTEWCYPAIGCTADGRIVLFCRSGEGTLLYRRGDDGMQVGFQWNRWDMNEFQPYRGSITLSS